MADKLPPEPKREDYATEDDFLEALAGWRHRVAPLLHLKRPSVASRPK